MLAKRISLSLLAIAMVSLVVSASSFALFSASSDNADNTFTAGTVTLDDPDDNLVDVENIAPGDSGTAGTYAITYSGSLDAWIGIDAWQSGDLFTCDTGDRFSVTMTDQDGNTYSTDANDQVVGVYSDGETLTLTVDYALDLDASNDCQGDSAEIEFRVKAVQFRNNDGGTGPISWS